MRDRVFTATLEHIEHADDVALDIAVRVLQRIPHARLGAQMHDALKPLLGEQGSDRLAIGQICMHETKTLLRLQPGETRVFERYVVILVQIIEADYLVAAIKQAQCSGGPNKARGTCNE